MLNLLFAGLRSDTGMKVFSIVIYFQIIAVLLSLLRWTVAEPAADGGNGRDREAKEPVLSTHWELLVLPMLVLPTVWVQVHTVTADLLTSLFFCSGIVSLVKDFESPSKQKLCNAALLLSFSAWTKPNVLLYLGLLPILWLSLCGWRLLRRDWMNFGLLASMIFVLLSPLLIRNFVVLRDPLYPALAGIFPDRFWSERQTAAVKSDSFPVRARGVADILLTPVRMTFSRGAYGSASEIGLVPLIILALYPFARKPRRLNRLFLYVLFCYLGWLFTASNFRQFLPPFLLLFLMSYYSFSVLQSRFPKLLIAVWILCSAVSLALLTPIFFSYFPLIHPRQTQSEYLSRHLDYYTMAEKTNQEAKGSKVLLLGETRTAYFHIPLVSCTAYDQSPFLRFVEESSTAEDLAARLKAEQVRYILYSPSEMRRLSRGLRIWTVSEKKRGLLSEFLQKNVVLRFRTSDLFLFEIHLPDAQSSDVLYGAPAAR